MMTFFFGLVAMILGAWGAYIWHHDLLDFLKGFFPLSLFFAGVIAAVVGIASLSPSHRLPPPGDKNGG
jgi:hypothetical protein